MPDKCYKLQVQYASLSATCISLSVRMNGVLVFTIEFASLNLESVLKQQGKTSLPYFGVKLSCVCLMFAYRKKVGVWVATNFNVSSRLGFKL